MEKKHSNKKLLKISHIAGFHFILLNALTLFLCHKSDRDLKNLFLYTHKHSVNCRMQLFNCIIRELSRNISVSFIFFLRKM